jgi:hypothetical protein
LLKRVAMVALVVLSAASVAFSSLLIASSIVLSMVRVDEDGNEEYPAAPVALCILVAVASVELMIISLVIRMTSKCGAQPAIAVATPSAYHFPGTKPTPTESADMMSPVTPSAPAAGPSVGQNNGGISYVYNAFFGGSANTEDFSNYYASGAYMPLPGEDQAAEMTQPAAHEPVAQTGIAHTQPVQPVTNITMI